MNHSPDALVRSRQVPHGQTEEITHAGGACDSLAVDVPLELGVAARHHGAGSRQIPRVVLLHVGEHVAQVHVDLGRVQVPPAVLDAPETPCQT